MSTLTGRYRCDHTPSLAASTVVEWFEHEADALARETELAAMYHGRAIAWHWPGTYEETAGEEGARLVREGLGLLVPWLREAS